MFLCIQIIFLQGSCLLKHYLTDSPVRRGSVSLLVLSTCRIVTYFVIGYRDERSGAAGIYSFSGDFATSQQRQASNADRQRKEKEAYEKRMRDLGTFIFCTYVL